MHVENIAEDQKKYLRTITQCGKSATQLDKSIDIPFLTFCFNRISGPGWYGSVD